MHASLISQLEAIGGMEEWVLYVAQHLPDGPSPDWQGLRDQLVRPMVLVVWNQNMLKCADAQLFVRSIEYHLVESGRKADMGGLPQVQQLLLRHAPALAASPEKRAFLRDRLGLSPAWLAHALMLWARYKRDTAGTI